MTTPSMIERVARAMYAHWAGEESLGEYPDWDSAVTKDEWLASARAAIEAMRSPVETEIRAILTRHFGAGQWRGKYRPKFTPAAREIAALLLPLDTAP